MGITHRMLVLVTLFVGSAHSWDIAVSVGDRLEFYTNGIKINTVHFNSHNLTALAYDDVHNMMLFVDKQSDNDAVCGYNLATTDIRCFIKRNGSNIQDIAFDPASDLLFFTDTKEGSINWISLKDQGFENNVYGNLLIKMDDRTVSGIALDSCRGYIYWTNNDELSVQKYMEKARFNGSEKEVVNEFLPVFSFAIDPQTQKIYYISGFTHEFHNEVDLGQYNLNDDNSKIIYMVGYVSKPKELTVSNDYVYWMNSSMSHTTVWQRPKNANLVSPVEPKEIIKFYIERPLAIAANYRIREQVQGLQNCEALSSLLVPAVDKREVSGCLNYCFQGSCNFNDDGHPECRCIAGYSGERCEVYACHSYCLNDGDCSLNEEDEPVCQCVGNYVGSRCEAVKNGNCTCW